MSCFSQVERGRKLLIFAISFKQNWFYLRCGTGYTSAAWGRKKAYEIHWSVGVARLNLQQQQQLTDDVALNNWIFRMFFKKIVLLLSFNNNHPWNTRILLIIRNPSLLFREHFSKKKEITNLEASFEDERQWPRRVICISKKRLWKN